MSRGTLGRRLPIAALMAVALLLASATNAQVTNRARVGVSGRNDTKGYSPNLFVVFLSPSAYRVGCCTDIDSGEWLGPRYQASGNASLGGDAKIAWRADFDRRSSSAGTAANAGLVQKWPQVAQSGLSVPHTVRGTRVGSIQGVAVVTRSPAEPAQFEAVLAFPLCRGLFVTTGFQLLDPFTDSTGGVAGQYMINGTLASAWNRQQADSSLQGISLDGFLPAASLTAHAAGAVITGVLRDCAHHPMPGVRVHVGSLIATTVGNGSYRLSRRGPKPKGQLVVTASAGGGTVRARVRP